jgi:hypothetical protein
MSGFHGEFEAKVLSLESSPHPFNRAKSLGFARPGAAENLGSFREKHLFSIFSAIRARIETASLSLGWPALVTCALTKQLGRPPADRPDNRNIAEVARCCDAESREVGVAGAPRASCVVCRESRSVRLCRSLRSGVSGGQIPRAGMTTGSHLRA